MLVKTWADEPMLTGTIPRWLDRRVLLTPDREAYCDSHNGVRLNFQELSEESLRLAQGFRTSGTVRKGDRVALLLENCAEFLVCVLALARIGAVVVPLNWRLAANELAEILVDCGPSVLVYGQQFVATMQALNSNGSLRDVSLCVRVGSRDGVPPFGCSYGALLGATAVAEPFVEVDPDDILFILYTSGTTGAPKGAVHTHSTVLAAVQTIVATLHYAEHERFFSPVPMFHVAALTPLLCNLYKGVTSVVMNSFEPELAWEVIAKERVTSGIAVPAMLNEMLRANVLSGLDVTSWRWCLAGAAPVPDVLVQRFAQLGVSLLQTYGLTESCGPACTIDPQNAMQRPGSTGKPFFHTDVRVARGDGSDCTPEEIGEVLVRGEHVMQGYWNQPEATASVFSDGWLRTGDAARVDSDGFLYIEDRIKDMLISGGENIFPAEIEKVLESHPAVRESAVIGQPSEKWGESPFAVVVRADPSVGEASLLEHLNGKLARYKFPRAFAFVESIPRNSSGKILKRELRESFPGPAPE